MSTEEIISLVKQKIPTIVGFDVGSNQYIIGDEARQTGLRGEGTTTVFNFKPAFGSGDAEFSSKEIRRERTYFLHYPKAKPAPKIETFTPKEAASLFLKTLFAKVEMPEAVIVGEPGIRDETWKANFRRHMREVFAELGLGQPEFFPEPFAVFQYYRHVAKVLPVADRPEIVLIIDIGGGTFNSCIIRTTESGLLSRGGATSVPLGLQAGTCGGSQIDMELFRILVHKVQKQGLVWKDDPIKRMEMKKGSALLRIEDAKIRLSETIAASGTPRLADDFSHISTHVILPQQEFYPDSEIQEVLTGEDLKSVIREMWRRYYGHLIIETVNEAKEKLMSAWKIPLNRLDKVLVAGGSSRLPFTKEEIQTVLPTLVERNDIIIGSDMGEAVAYGIAWECHEQVRRDPKLSIGKIAPCVLKDLYVGFRETRRDTIQIPRLKNNGKSSWDGQLLSAPFETEESVFKYELELPFDPSDRLLYVFTDKPIVPSEDDPERLNLNHDIFSLPKLGKLNRKCELQLEVKPTGLVKPTFWFHGRGISARKLAEKVTCPEFYFAGFQIKEGNAYIGLDFGNSNSYLVKFANIPHEITASEYPEFKISLRVKDRLRRLELTIQDLREKNLLSEERLMEQALDEALEVIFHSNKIEGSPLTKGETETVLSQTDRQDLSEKELEAKNLETAYYWMLENFQSVFDQPEAFVRQINHLILKDVKPDGGQYRTDKVSLSGMDFVPPQASSVAAFMQQLGDEIKSRGVDRSALEFATSLHTKLVWIHPFADGNGRTARLLLNACLLAQGLPVVVVNYADRLRYLHCLSESNEGDLSSMVGFFIESFKQQLEELSRVKPQDTGQREDTEDGSQGIVFEAVPTVVDQSVPTPEAEVDSAIDQAIQEVTSIEQAPLLSPGREVFDTLNQAMEEVGRADVEDLLTAVMREKVIEQGKILKADYDAWKQSFLTVLADLRAIVEVFNHQYAEAGFKIKLQEYDLLTFEKYDDFRRGKIATRTWYASLVVSSLRGRERVLFQFEHATRAITKDPKVSRVSLFVSRFDGSRYRRLQTEPINLREIGYRDGELLFISPEGIMPIREIRQTLRLFLAELIKAFL